MATEVRGIFIPGDVRSSKNSRQLIYHKNKATGKSKPIIIHSKTVTKYIKQTKLFWLEQKKPFLELVKDMEYPYLLFFHFVRGSRRKWDGTNLLQLPQDLMVKYGYIADDNMENLVPQFLKVKGKWFSYDKENPGLYIIPYNKENKEALKQAQIKVWKEENNLKKELK